MKFCTRCGQPLDNTARFCVRCGSAQGAPAALGPVPTEPTQNTFLPAAPTPAFAGMPQPVVVLPHKKRSPVTLLGWALLMIFVLNPVGTPLAIAAAYFGTLANAKDETPEDAERHMDYGVTLCLISTCTDVLCLILLVVLTILSANGTILIH